MTHHSKYVNLLVRQLDDEDLRAERNEENHYYNSEPWDQVTKNSFFTYHQVKAQTHWFALRPHETEHYKKFQVRTCI